MYDTTKGCIYEILSTLNQIGQWSVKLLNSMYKLRRWPRQQSNKNNVKHTEGNYRHTIQLRSHNDFFLPKFAYKIFFYGGRMQPWKKRNIRCSLKILCHSHKIFILFLQDAMSFPQDNYLVPSRCWVVSTKKIVTFYTPYKT